MNTNVIIIVLPVRNHERLGMALDLENPNDFQNLSSVVKGFSNHTRLALLLGFRHGYTVQEIADFLEMTRGGLQNNIYRMIDADLVYRPSRDDRPAYALTPFGQFFARQFNRYGPSILEAQKLLAQTEAELAEEIDETPLADGLDDNERAKLIHTKKWLEHDHDIAKLLRQSGAREYEPPEQEPEDIPSAIISQIAELEGVHPDDLATPLSHAIDIELLEQSFSSRSGPPPDLIQFTYLDYTVKITADGEVDVQEATSQDIASEG